MGMTRYVIPLVPATASGATAFSSVPVHQGGFLEAVRLVRPTTNQITTVAKLTITGEQSGITLFAATATSTGSQTWLPRQQVCDVSGLLLNLEENATTPSRQVDKIPIGNERIKAVVASGGANTSGVLHLYISGA